MYEDSVIRKENTGKILLIFTVCKIFKLETKIGTNRQKEVKSIHRIKSRKCEIDNWSNYFNFNNLSESFSCRFHVLRIWWVDFTSPCRLVLPIIIFNSNSNILQTMNKQNFSAISSWTYAILVHTIFKHSHLILVGRLEIIYLPSCRWRRFKVESNRRIYNLYKFVKLLIKRYKTLTRAQLTGFESSKPLFIVIR